jgi:cytochrome c-type biogenesis protein CcmH
MSRFLLLVMLALALAPLARASERQPTLAEMETEIMCPVCKAPLDMSNAPAAQRIEAYIQRRIDAGATKSQIKDELVVQFGPGILAEPRKEGFDLIAWLLPLGGVLVGAVALAVAARHWSRVRSSAPEVALDAELEHRVDDALARYDA